MTEANGKNELSIREIVERGWRTWPRVLQFWLVMGLLTLFFLLFWPRSYSSSAQLFLQVGRESIGLDPTANATGKTIGLQQSGRDSEIKSAIDILKSRGMIEQVVDALSPEVVLGQVAVGEAKPNPVGEMISQAVGRAVELLRSIDPASDRERAVVEIEKNLVVDAERKSEVIAIVYEADSPELAQMVVDAIVETYRNKHPEYHRTPGSTDFFDQQSQRLKRELEETTNRLRETKNSMGLASIEGQRQILETQLGDLRNDLMVTEKQIFSARAKADSLTKQLSDIPDRLSSSEVNKPNAAIEMQQQLLYALQIQQAEALAKFTPNHPQVRALRQQVAAAQSELKKQEGRSVETTDGINPIHQELLLEQEKISAELASWEARQQKLVAQEADVMRQVRQLNADSIVVEQLQRDVAVASRKYVTYVENLEEARVDQEMQRDSISSVRVVQNATLQEKPTSPSKPLTVALGGLATMLGTLGLILLGVQFDDRIGSTSSIRRQLGVPVLGAVPAGRPFATVHG